jgi:quinolinate synthase
MLWQEPLPRSYTEQDDSSLHDAIAARRAELGNRVVILGHHYQQDQVIVHADFTGDSFKLSQLAAEKVQEVGAEHVIFCGVHFMAESADILTPESITVTLPDMGAGCSMADMATEPDVRVAWEQIHQALAGQKFVGRVVPITYMNSSAAIKAFVGNHGGAVCTSSNARGILEWAFAGGTEPVAPGEQIKILFLPDQHLGRNTAAEMGYDVQKQMTVWDPRATTPLGGNDPQTLLDASVLLWKGHCSVHKLFRPEHVDQARAADPNVHVIVHPECDHQVVLRADSTGSTEGIMRAIESAEPGSSWAVGTEIHMVNRLAAQAALSDVRVRILSDCQCLCTTMYRIDPPHLLWALDRFAAGEVINRIQVDDQTRRGSLLSLKRMLQITSDTAAATAGD